MLGICRSDKIRHSKTLENCGHRHHHFPTFFLNSYSKSVTLHNQPALFDIQARAQAWHVILEACPTGCIFSIFRQFWFVYQIRWVRGRWKRREKKKRKEKKRKEKTCSQISKLFSLAGQAALTSSLSFTALRLLLSLSNTSRQIDGREKESDRQMNRGWEDWGEGEVGRRANGCQEYKGKRRRRKRRSRRRCGEGGEGRKGDWRDMGRKRRKLRKDAFKCQALAKSQYLMSSGSKMSKR